MGWIQIGLLVFSGVGVGALLVPARPAHWPRIGWFALTMLCGCLFLAAALNALGALGFPRAVSQVFAYGAAAYGWFPWCQRARNAALVPRRDEVATAAIVLFLLFVPWTASMAGPTRSHDTGVIWYPKILEILNFVVPTPDQLDHAWPTHAHALYPRGLAWLAVMGDPAGVADPIELRTLSLLFTTLGSLVISGWLLAAGRRWLGWLSVVLLLSVPEIAVQLALGMSDLPVGMGILVAIVGLALARGADPNFVGEAARRAGWRIAAIGAAGAASVKQEGSIVWIAVALASLLGMIRAPRGERRHLLAVFAILALVLPWSYIRSRCSGEVLANVQIATNPLFVGDRVGIVIEKIFFQMTSPAAFDPTGNLNAKIPIVGWFLLTGCLALLLFRRRPVPFWPALLLLCADLGIYVVTIHDVAWHVATSAERLWLQLSPALVLALFSAVGAADRETEDEAEHGAAPVPAPAPAT